MLGVHSAVDVHAWSSLGRTPLLEGFSSKAEEATAVHPHRSPTVPGSILFLVHTPPNLATGKSAHLADGSAPLTALRPHFRQSPRPQHMWDQAIRRTGELWGPESPSKHEASQLRCQGYARRALLSSTWCPVSHPEAGSWGTRGLGVVEQGS